MVGKTPEKTLLAEVRRSLHLWLRTYIKQSDEKKISLRMLSFIYISSTVQKSSLVNVHRSHIDILCTWIASFVDSNELQGVTRNHFLVKCTTESNNIDNTPNLNLLKYRTEIMLVTIYFIILTKAR